MRRVVCIWLPTFATDLVRRRMQRDRGWRSPEQAGQEDSKEPRTAIVLTRAVASRELVERCCALARAAGITPGMDLAHARSLLPANIALHTEPHRPDRDSEALHALACWALRFTPLAAPEDSANPLTTGLMLDITGTQRLHKGEKRTLRAIAGHLRKLGFLARIASAAHFGAAWAVSRYGEHDVGLVAPGREREAIEKLPTGAIRLDPDTLRGLAEIGIVRVEHLLRLPRHSLATRFDPLLVRRLHQALGEIGERIEPVRPRPPIVREMIFEGPTDRWDSIEEATWRVLSTLAADLATQERGVRRLDISLMRPRTEPTRLVVSLSHPSRSPDHLWSLVRSQLEKVDLGQVAADGVEGVVMTATRTGRLRHRQSASDALGGEEDREHNATAFGELIDTLVGRLGADQVVWREPVESHLPERVVRERSVMEGRRRVVATTPAGASGIVGDRPSLLFPKPEPADVMAVTPDGPLISLGWRGQRWTVTQCIGPERIGAEWWRWTPRHVPTDDEPPHKKNAPKRKTPAATPPPPPDRDYFAVQTDEGRWLWVCRQAGTTSWFVHGEWC